jgi:hypothetical protein
VTTPPALEIVLVVLRPDDVVALDVVVVVGLFAVVVVDEVPEFLPDFFFESFGFSVVVVDGGGGGAVVAVTVLVVEGAAATDASTRDPAAAPGRGSVLAGDAVAGLDAAPAEGLAGASSVGGEAGGFAGSGAGVTGRAAWVASAVGTDRAAWSARRTSGWESGDTRLVEKRDETSWTPNNPRSTPLAVPRAHVSTRTRRTAKWWALPRHGGVKTMLNQRQDGRLRR